MDETIARAELPSVDIEMGWHARLLAAQRLEREADARYRALIAALAGDVPVYGAAAAPVAIAAE